MKPSSFTPSARLVRAAAAERSGLERRRRALVDRGDRLRAELDEVQRALAETDERLLLLDRITGGQQPVRSSGRVEHRSAATVEDLSPATVEHDSPAQDENRSPATATTLRGPHIRRAAVALLLGRPDKPEALHYREWFGLLREAGYEVGGKDPLAVFLTQLGRSPVVRRGTQAGIYELDLTAPRRLRQQLDDLQAQLRTLTALSPSPTTDLSTIRTRRTALALEIGKVEKSLQEADETLRGVTHGGSEKLASASG